MWENICRLVRKMKSLHVTSCMFPYDTTVPSGIGFPALEGVCWISIVRSSPRFSDHIAPIASIISGVNLMGFSAIVCIIVKILILDTLCII